MARRGVHLLNNRWRRLGNSTGPEGKDCGAPILTGYYQGDAAEALCGKAASRSLAKSARLGAADRQRRYAYLP